MSDEGKDVVDQALEVCAAAWGKQSGYAFFPWIRGDAKNKEERIRSFREGKAWFWPTDRDAIADWLRTQGDHDVYWCPNLFEYPRRRGDFAMDERCLWSDLDEVDPRTIQDYPPTIAWETSPGRYQALWLAGAGADLQGASWPGNENQRMTKHLDADQSGWDSTQLLRLPGWANHKPEYRRKDGSTPPIKGLIWPRWRSRRRWYLDDFEDLPEIPRVEGVDAVLEEAVDSIDAAKLWTDVRLKLKPATRQLYATRQATGDRSDKLWILEREFADAGLTATQIIALIRRSAWNKYAGRADEFHRLVMEAHKAVSMKAEKDDLKRKDKARGALEEVEVVDDEGGVIEPQRLFTLIKNVKQPRWLIKDIWTEAACGFIAGQPKQHKSWFGLDMGLSVATGMPFLGHFRVERPGPVLYVQEEDSLPELKRRISLMWGDKRADRMVVDEEGDVAWLPPVEMVEPDVTAIIQKGFVLSDPSWQSWLDEQLEKGMDDAPYRMVIMDPMMMMLGDVEENKAASMTESIFKPLKQLSTKHGVAICLVHHMRKGATEGRGGQLMLGSMANHAWAHDAMYLTYGAKRELLIERESKSAPAFSFEVRLRKRSWEPSVINLTDDDAAPENAPSSKPRQKTTIKNVDKASGIDPTGLHPILQLMLSSDKKGWTTPTLAEALGQSPMITQNQCTSLLKQGKLHKYFRSWMIDHAYLAELKSRP